MKEWPKGLGAVVLAFVLLYIASKEWGRATGKERKKIAKELNFNRVNIPKNGLPAGQLMLIYKKYAEKNPEGLNGSARICLYEAIVDSYGWK